MVTNNTAIGYQRPRIAGGDEPRNIASTREGASTGNGAGVRNSEPFAWVSSRDFFPRQLVSVNMTLAGNEPWKRYSRKDLDKCLLLPSR